MKEHQAGQIVFGRYDLLRPLARGGMSSLWVASDRKLKRDVALKLMATTYADQERSRQRFELEAMAVARLQSPHIVQIYDYGVDNRSPFIVMELLQGEDLRSRLKKARTLPLSAVAKLVHEVGLGLSEAHEAGLVHRDLKPGNIFLATTRSGEVPKILDFGVAKASSEGEALSTGELTEQGTLVGTPQYMSPEQVRCLPEIDLRADVFSLGVIVYRALAGRLPFRGATQEDLRVNICVSAFPPLTSLVQGLPPQIDAVLERALAKEADDRFQTVQELSQALSAAAAAAPPGPTTPLWPVDGQGRLERGSLSQSWPSGSGLASRPSSSGMGAPHSDFPSGTLGSGDGSTHTSPSNGVASSIETTLLEQATQAQMLSQRWRQIAIIAMLASVLAVVAIAGSVMVRDSEPEAELAPASAGPQDAPEPASDPALPSVEPIDLDDDDEPAASATATASSAVPPKKPQLTPRPRPPAPPPPPVKPAPQPSEDWDPFKKRN